MRSTILVTYYTLVLCSCNKRIYIVSRIRHAINIKDLGHFSILAQLYQVRDEELGYVCLCSTKGNNSPYLQND